MPLTHKGEEIKASLAKEYGAKKGEQILYAGKNAGTFTGIDAERLDGILTACDRLEHRMDALTRK